MSLRRRSPQARMHLDRRRALVAQLVIRCPRCGQVEPTMPDIARTIREPFTSQGETRMSKPIPNPLQSQVAPSATSSINPPFFTPPAVGVGPDAFVSGKGAGGKVTGVGETTGTRGSK